MFITRGIAFTVTKGRSILITHPVFDFIGQGELFGTPFPLILFVIIAIILIVIMNYSKFARLVYAIGANQRASFLSGINVEKVKFLLFLLCGCSSAVGGLILTSMSQVGMPQHGMGTELPIISAVILGGTALGGGRGKIIGTIIGVVIISVLYNGLTMMSVLYYHVQIAQGLALILIVSAYEARKQPA
jgi:ribose/xylose/arabinose/galactoside ABC-type transport system permease subunit